MLRNLPKDTVSRHPHKSTARQEHRPLMPAGEGKRRVNTESAGGDETAMI
jgi:hypothetical protein